MKFLNKIKINNLEEIGVDQLIWEIDNSKDFSIYEISDDHEVTNILVKIQRSEDI